MLLNFLQTTSNSKHLLSSNSTEFLNRIESNFIKNPKSSLKSVSKFLYKDALKNSQKIPPIFNKKLFSKLRNFIENSLNFLSHFFCTKNVSSTVKTQKIPLHKTLYITSRNSNKKNERKESSKKHRQNTKFLWNFLRTKRYFLLLISHKSSVRVFFRLF